MAADRRKLIEAAVPQVLAFDPRPARERLADYARRGVDSPESLSLYEIGQIAFALVLYLEMDKDD